MSKPHFVTDSKVVALTVFVVADCAVFLIIIILAVRRKKKRAL